MEEVEIEELCAARGAGDRRRRLGRARRRDRDAGRGAGRAAVGRGGRGARLLLGRQAARRPAGRADRRDAPTRSARARATRSPARCGSTSSRWPRSRRRCGSTATRRRAARDPGAGDADAPTRPCCARGPSGCAAAADGEVVAAVARVGGGALPLLELPGPAVAVVRARRRARRARRAAAGRATRPWSAAIEDGRLLLDPRTLTDDESLPGGRGRALAAASTTPLTLGTAGHIDHGKTALVRALTGVDTDRLPEERERGISIELGYARARAAVGPRGSRVVDVPGHERFVRTMVAGATGIDLFLMTIAADDGVMPQTREHAAVLAALGVATGVVAITKADLADPDRAPRGGDGVAPRRRSRSGLGANGRGARRAARGARAGGSRRPTPHARRTAAAARRPRVHDPRRGHRGHRHAVVGQRGPRRRGRAPAVRPPCPRALRRGPRRAARARRGRPARRAQPRRRRVATRSRAGT